MDLKEILGYVTVAMAFAVYLPYYASVLKGKTRPHLYTYLIGFVVTVIAFFGSVVGGASAGAWNIGASALLVGGVLVLSIKHGTKDIQPIDTVLTVAAGSAIIPWFLTHDPMLSVILASTIDSVSMFPTLRKTWSDPASEPWTLWGLNAVKHVLAIAALSTYSITTLVYPAAMVIMNVLLTAEIIFRRQLTQVK